ncbi:MAG: CapA family protein [Mariprofundaceae bacterium]|nr:CapA family protein [Mariprofundaceae bacterium]
MKHLYCLSLSFLLLSACATPPKPMPMPPLPLTQKEHIPSPVQAAIKATTFTIVAVGDIMMGGTALPIMQEQGYDRPFAKTKHLFSHADAVIGNLEGPLSTRGIADKDKKYVFRSPADKVGPALKNAGFDVLTLANNHSLDYGVTALNDTIDALKQQNLAHIGAGNNLKEARKPHIMEKNGFKVGFLGYSLTYPEEFWAKDNRAGTVFGYEHTIRQDIQRLRQQVDSIVVSFHWGREGTTKLRAYQPRLGRIAIDEGAALVIGHHPHIMQAVERYKHGVILYSLGNYVFGSYSQRSPYGGIAQVVLNQHGFAKLTLTPIDTNNFRRHFQPQPLTGKPLNQALESIQNLSRLQHTETIIYNEQLVLQGMPQE